MHPIISDIPEVRALEQKRVELEAAQRKLIEFGKAAEADFTAKLTAWQQDRVKVSLKGEVAAPPPIPPRYPIAEQVHDLDQALEKNRSERRTLLVDVVRSGKVSDLHHRERELHRLAQDTPFGKLEPIRAELEELRATVEELARAVDATGNQTIPRETPAIARESFTAERVDRWLREPFKSLIGIAPEKWHNTGAARPWSSEPPEDRLRPDEAKHRAERRLFERGGGTEI